MNPAPSLGDILAAGVKPADAISPEHYARFKIEPIDYVMANGLNYAEGNVIKYTSRHRYKNGAEDVRKGISYLIQLLAIEYGAAEVRKVIADLNRVLVKHGEAP